jgi:hypothetical protein
MTMLKSRARARRRKANNWKTWSSIAAEGRRVNRQICKESAQMVTKTDELIAAITEAA